MALLLCGFLTGCLIPTVAKTRRPLSSKTNDFSFVRVGETTLSDITNRVGRFDEYFDDFHIGAYHLNEITRWRLWLAFGVLPISVTSIQDREDITYFEFDQSDRLTRHETVVGVGGHYGAKKWIERRK